MSHLYSHSRKQSVKIHFPAHAISYGNIGRNIKFYDGSKVTITDCSNASSHSVNIYNSSYGSLIFHSFFYNFYKKSVCLRWNTSCCRIGNNCILHAGSVVGADGFGFAPSPEGYEKIPQIGIAILEDNVEIGANTCIDRATMGATIIRKGVKLDNLIQIAHNVEVGSNTVMASQVGVAGSTKIGEWCMLGGQVGVAGHITIGNKVNMGAQSGVHGSIKDGEALIGTPPIGLKNYFKSSAVFKKLPEMYLELNSLKKEIEELKKQLNK